MYTAEKMQTSDVRSLTSPELDQVTGGIAPALAAAIILAEGAVIGSIAALIVEKAYPTGTLKGLRPR